MAADAADGLARLSVSGAAHGLDGEALRVQRLEEQGHPRGHTKPGRAVGFDGHGAQHAFPGVIMSEAHVGKVHGRVGLGGNGHDAQSLDVAALYFPSPR